MRISHSLFRCNVANYRKDSRAKITQVKPGKANARLPLLPTGTVGAVEPPVTVVDAAPPVASVVFHLTEPVADSVAPVGVAGMISEVL